MRILVTEPIAAGGIEMLAQNYQVDVHLGLTRQELIAQIGEYEALITRSGTAVTPDLLEAARKLRVVGRAGIGVDNIDIAAATRHGVAVVNAPNGNVRAAAEHTIGMLFALARSIPQADKMLRDGVWGKNKFMGWEIAGKTLGIIGLGKVGNQVAQKAQALGMNVIAYDPFRDPVPGIPMVELDDLLRQVDVVTLHVPLTPITRHMIGERELALMRPGAYILNVARGQVIDEVALYAACKAGSIAGAALDVFEHEPLGASPLLELPNVIFTPHLGGTTREAMDASGLEVANDIAAVLQGRTPGNVLNPEALPGTVFPAQLGRNLSNWRAFETIVLDCDSTLTTIEGVDELAEMNGCKEEVAALTEQAMDGRMALDEVFSRRVEMIRPSREQTDTLGDMYVGNMAEDAAEVVAALQLLEKRVMIVSGGWKEALLSLAGALGIAEEDVLANRIYFDESGRYQGYDEEHPLARAGGKAEVLKQVLPGPDGVLLVGDGATDAEARHAAELFVGHGGVTVREAVRDSAGVYLRAASLAPLLVIAAGCEGLNVMLKEPRFRNLAIKGIGLLLRPGYAEGKDDYAWFVHKVRKYALQGICD